MEPFITYQQAAEFLGCSVSALYTLVSRRKIKHYRHGRIVRFRQSDLAEFLKVCEARLDQQRFVTTNVNASPAGSKNRSDLSCQDDRSCGSTRIALPSRPQARSTDVYPNERGTTMSPSLAATADDGALLTTAQAAQRLGVKPQTLRKMRHQGRGPAYVRLGGQRSRAMYEPSALDAWKASRTYTSTTAEASHPR